MNKPLALCALALCGAALLAAKGPGLFDFSVHTLDGKPLALSVYRGKVVLVVNTASRCGYTPQYEGLEKLWRDYKDRGVVLLGVPSNDFGGQEPGGPAEIAQFCKLHYGVTFPLLEKSHTRGSEASPLFRFLAATHGEPKWNFTKYLVGKDGQVRRAFPSAVTPESAELRGALDAALKE